MTSSFQRRLTSLADPIMSSTLRNIQRGIEKESLRIQPNGLLAQTPHPLGLGSALTNPKITTDYSEALLEFITPVYKNIDDALHCLDEIHRFVYSQLEDNELLWVASMPCVLEGDDNIPVAQYGSSNVAKMKTTYRLGLGHRYGRLMQTISGIHYNFSLPEEFWPHYQSLHNNKDSLQTFRTDAYFGLIRNFRRHFWLAIYLFGSAPAVCKTFLNGQEHQLATFNDGTFYAPYGTSLRMGDLGYQSNAQSELIVCYNTLDNYMETLSSALNESHQPYETIGVKVDGSYRQLNTNLLQIENEFYSSIRPKRVAQSGETPLHALRDRGVEYIEVRCVDVDPCLPLGIDAEQIYFLDTFLLYCLLQESPTTNPVEYSSIAENQEKIVNRGREPDLTLNDRGRQRTVVDWGTELLTGMQDVAKLLDDAHSSTDYSNTIQKQLDKISNPALTPSAKIIADMEKQDLGYFKIAMQYAKQHKAHFASRPLTKTDQSLFDDLATTSMAQQHEIEASDTVSFDEYLQNYYQQE